MQVQSPGWEDPLQMGRATHSSTLAWRIPWTESLAGYSPWGHQESDVTEATEQARTHRQETIRTHPQSPRLQLL